MQGSLDEFWAPAACSSRHLDYRFFVWKESLALFFSSGIINPFEEWAALGLWHLTCDVCPRFSPAVPATQLLTWGLAMLKLVRMSGVAALLGSQPPLQPQCPPLSAATGPQTSSLISRSRCKCVFLVVSKKPCVSVGEGVFAYGGGAEAYAWLLGI